MSVRAYDTRFPEHRRERSLSDAHRFALRSYFLVETGYRTIEFPFRELQAPDVAISLDWTRDDLLDYVRTWSATGSPCRFLFALAVSRGLTPLPRRSSSNKRNPLPSAGVRERATVPTRILVLDLRRKPGGWCSAPDSRRLSLVMASSYPQPLVADPALAGLHSTSGALLRFDRLLGVGALSVSLPLIAASALVVAILSRRKPFVAIERVGQGGRPFWMLKLRTMWGTGDRPSGAGFVERLAVDWIPEHKGGLDPRVTSVFATLCRKYSIDELPQLWHVVTGRMSLVGPRPLTATEITQYYGACASEVLSLRPGLTGLWQTRGRNALTYGRRRRWDIHLVRNFSWRLYGAILLRTIPCVIAGRNAW
ncbi:MAG: sugar transferase [Bryobacteraceae bacterium]